MTTTRETADHAELAAELRAFEGSDDLGNGDFTVCEFAADAIENLLSEIAALRGERSFLVEQKEGAEDAIFNAIARATQAERQRDEAVGLLRGWTARDPRTPGLGLLRLQQKTDALLANQGADQ